MFSSTKYLTWMSMQALHSIFFHPHFLWMATWAAVTSALSTAERSCPTSEVRGRSREDPMPERRQPGGVTPRPRSGSVAKSARLLRRRNGWEEQTHAWGQGKQSRGATSRPRSSGYMGSGGPREAIPCPRSGRAAVRRYPSSKVRSSGCTLLEHLWRDTPRPR